MEAEIVVLSVVGRGVAVFTCPGISMPGRSGRSLIGCSLG
jgi:hypothetical protein